MQMMHRFSRPLARPGSQSGIQTQPRWAFAATSRPAVTMHRSLPFSAFAVERRKAKMAARTIVLHLVYEISPLPDTLVINCFGTEEIEKPPRYSYRGLRLSTDTGINVGRNLSKNSRLFFQLVSRLEVANKPRDFTSPPYAVCPESKNAQIHLVPNRYLHLHSCLLSPPCSTPHSFSPPILHPQHLLLHFNILGLPARL